MQNLADDPTTAVPHATCSEQPPAISKNQQKKLLKKERLAQLKVARKAEEKAAKAADKGQRHDALGQRLAGMSTEEKEEFFKGAQAKKAERRRVTDEKRDKMKQAMEGGMKLVLDLDFADKMAPNEIVSVCQQISYSYSANTKVPSPCHLHLTSLQGTIETNLRQRITGLANWFVTLTPSSYLEHFSEQRDKLVYLTADSPNTLQEFEPDKIYIVGGLVDRNRHKQLCFNKATEQGIQTARLPIGEHVAMGTSQVITINQVVQIVVQKVNSNDWPTVLAAVLPTRKVTEAAHGHEQQENRQKQEATRDVKVGDGADVGVQGGQSEEVQARVAGVTNSSTAGLLEGGDSSKVVEENDAGQQPPPKRARS